MIVNQLPILGKTIVNITRSNKDGDSLTFKTSDGETYQMYHEQDCCESVSIEDICGDLDDLLNSPILLAEEVIKSEDSIKSYDSVTWTFYKIGTNRGAVTIRWYGTSNGYYSERVDFIKVV